GNAFHQYTLITIYQVTLLHFSTICHHLYPQSFPTRRSSDLRTAWRTTDPRKRGGNMRIERVLARLSGGQRWLEPGMSRGGIPAIDRKSTRLNSSHVKISYAVFCLKNKKTYCIPTVSPFTINI